VFDFRNDGNGSKDPAASDLAWLAPAVSLKPPASKWYIGSLEMTASASSWTERYNELSDSIYPGLLPPARATPAAAAVAAPKISPNRRAGAATGSPRTRVASPPLPSSGPMSPPKRPLGGVPDDDQACSPSKTSVSPHLRRAISPPVQPGLPASGLASPPAFLQALPPGHKPPAGLPIGSLAPSMLTGLPAGVAFSPPGIPHSVDKTAIKREP
jgi:hypothetical protein